jgi:outer membrane protein assembly factor BamB
MSTHDSPALAHRLVKSNRRNAALLALALLGSPWVVRAADNWPQFRGPTGFGYTEEKNLPVKWGGPNRENVLWQAPLVGQGHASPVVWGDAVFVCTVFWPANVTARERVVPEHHVLCYHAASGKLLWDTVVPPGPWLRTDFRSGPGGGYAAPTPATDGKLVYCVFGSAVMAALDFQGKIVWRKEIIPYSFDVTIGSSPILYQDTLILFCAMAKASDSAVIAFDRSNGEVKWRQKFPDMAFGHSTPIIIQVKDQPQMLVLASGMGMKDNALRSLHPADGRVLWWCRGGGDASSPAYGSGLVYFDSGRGGPGTAVDPTGSGDVSKTHIRWTVGQVPEAIGSPIIVGEHVYRLHSPGIVKCWETATGKERYAERLAGLSSTWASPIADPNGRLYFANAGKSYVLQAGPEFRVLAVNDLEDGSHPSPAAARNRLYLLGQKNLYCVGAEK